MPFSCQLLLLIAPFHATSVERFARCCNARGELDEFVMALVRLGVHIHHIMIYLQLFFCNIFACFELGNLNNLSGAHPIATMKFVHQDSLWWRRTVFNWDSRHLSNRIELKPRREHGAVPGSWTHGFTCFFYRCPIEIQMHHEFLHDTSETSSASDPWRCEDIGIIEQLLLQRLIAWIPPTQSLAHPINTWLCIRVGHANTRDFALFPHGIDALSPDPRKANATNAHHGTHPAGCAFSSQVLSSGLQPSCFSEALDPPPKSRVDQVGGFANIAWTFFLGNSCLSETCQQDGRIIWLAND